MRGTAQWVLSLTLAAGVVATGGVHKESYSAMELAILGVFTLLLLQQSVKGKIEIPFTPVVVLMIFVVVVQLIPLPENIVQWLSPQRWEHLPLEISESGDSWVSLSTYPHATWVAFVKILAYLAVFMLSAYIFDSRKRSSLVFVLIFIGLAEGLLGLVLYLGGWQDILPFSSRYGRVRARGSYINPNHFAAVLAMTSPFLLGRIYYLHQRGRDHLLGGRSASGEGRKYSVSGQVPFYIFLLLTMLVALVLSGSRMGIFSAFSALLLVVLLSQLKGRQTKLLASSFIVLGGVLVYLLWIGLGSVIPRFEALLEAGYLESNARVLVWKDELRLLYDYPWLGTGLGTFGIVFKKYQASSLNYWFDQAHNDYLQFSVELGLLGFLAFFGPIFWLLIRMMRSFMNDPSRFRASVTLGCIGGSFALLVHSFTDFNLQIPANAMIFAVILGIGYKASCLERKAEANLG